MTESLISTKFFIPALRSELISRPRLRAILDDGLDRKITLVSAPAGFGKTTLLADWLQGSALKKREGRGAVRSSWLSLDENDNDPARFCSYLTSALVHYQIIRDADGSELLEMLRSSPAPDLDGFLTELINLLAGVPHKVVMVLDDYHHIQSQAVHKVLNFLLENAHPHFHLVIATREDPFLPLGKLRARSLLTELRASDLRFREQETADFLQHVMGLELTPGDIAQLESRTEGWIAGLQLAAVSLQGQENAPELISSFSGSHRFVVDFLIEEVLGQQPENIRAFLLQTSILEQLTGTLCDAVVGTENSQRVLENLERSNLFIIPLDNERHWYRYHHLFADLLRNRLQANGLYDITALHIRASIWYEENGLGVESFQHAIAAGDKDRAARLVQESRIPVHRHGVVGQILKWLDDLPQDYIQSKPALLIKHARMLLAAGQTQGVEEKLQLAEEVLGRGDQSQTNRDLLGRIAANRATLASTQYQAQELLEQARLALELLDPENKDYYGSTSWKLGYAHLLQGDRTAALQAYAEAVALTKSAQDFNHILALIGLGWVQEEDTQLVSAERSYRQALQLFGKHPQPISSQAMIGLARIYYEWNDLESARKYALAGLERARQFGSNIDRSVVCELFLCKLELARGRAAEAAELLAEIKQTVQQRNFLRQQAAVAAMEVRLLLGQGKLAAAAEAAAEHKIPLSQARIQLARDAPAAALDVLGPYLIELESRDWKEERMRALVLQALALHAEGDEERAYEVLVEILALAEPGRYLRSFIEEGPAMARLLYGALSRDIAPGYLQSLLAAFPEIDLEPGLHAGMQSSGQGWIEPLTEREIEVLQLLAEGLSNQEIGDRLYLSLNTIKSHSRSIYAKLGVNKRTLAINKARSLGIIGPA